MRSVFLASVLLILLTSCRAAATEAPLPTSVPPTPTTTPLPPTPTVTPLPPTATTPPTGITGTVAYTGPLKGAILILALDHLPLPDQPPAPAAITTFDDISGQFRWDLPAGTYYIIAFLTIDRAPEGPAQANEPLVQCEPILLGANETVNVEVILTDEDVGGSEKACVKTD